MAKTKNTKAMNKKKTSKDLVLEKLDELNKNLNRNNFEHEELDELWDELFALLEKGSSDKNKNLTNNLRNQRWTTNHLKIKAAIDDYVRESNIIPSAYQIARKIGLSRQTVSKHLKEFQTHELYSEEMKAQEFCS